MSTANVVVTCRIHKLLPIQIFRSRVSWKTTISKAQTNLVRVVKIIPSHCFHTQVFMPSCSYRHIMHVMHHPVLLCDTWDGRAAWPDAQMLAYLPLIGISQVPTDGLKLKGSTATNRCCIIQVPTDGFIWKGGDSAAAGFGGTAAVARLFEGNLA